MGTLLAERQVEGLLFPNGSLSAPPQISYFQGLPSSHSARIELVEVTDNQLRINDRDLAVLQSVAFRKPTYLSYSLKIKEYKPKAGMTTTILMFDIMRKATC